MGRGDTFELNLKNRMEISAEGLKFEGERKGRIKEGLSN
jgi:hypothetical protein